jgi:hypothetical protein
MSRLYDIYQRLRSIQDSSVDRAMAAALPTADPLAAKMITLNLLEREHPEGTASLVLYYDRLLPDIQARVIRLAPQWYRPLREAAGRKDIHGPANAIRIIVEAKIARLAYLITEQLHHRPDDLRKQAAEGLLELARWAGTATCDQADHAKQPTRCDVTSVAYIQAAVEEAVRLYHTHLQPAALMAYAAMAYRSMPEILRQLQDPSSPAVEEFRILLSTAKNPDIRRVALVLVQIPTLTDAVFAGLKATGAGQGLVDVLSGSHLLLNQRIRRPLRSLTQPLHLWPVTGDVAQWPTQTTRGLARWAQALPMTARERVEHLTKVSEMPDALSRLNVLRQLIAISQSGQDFSANDAIARFCNDPQERLAKIALRYLIYARWDGLTGLLTRAVNSKHNGVAQLARARLAPLGFARLWEHWPSMSAAKKLSAGRALIKIDALFHSHLSSKLMDGQDWARLRALSIIHGLNQGLMFELPLLAMVGDQDPKIASAAVRALGSARSERAVKALEKVLDHEDSRVRANAVEALEQLQSTRHVRQLVEMAHEEQQSRPRANAIRALLQMGAGDALSELVKMLHDPRPAQRISALWVIEAVGLIEVAHQVAEMSITDTDINVKSRADHVVHGLIAVMKHGLASGGSAARGA